MFLQVYQNIELDYHDKLTTTSYFATPFPPSQLLFQKQLIKAKKFF